MLSQERSRLSPGFNTSKMASNSADAMDISETVVFKNQNLSDDEQSSHSGNYSLESLLENG